MIRPADVIGVQMREPNLSDISLFENPIESGLLFFVTRRGINNNHFVAANHITIRMSRRRQRRRTQRNQDDTRTHFDFRYGLSMSPWNGLHSLFDVFETRG